MLNLFNKNLIKVFVLCFSLFLTNNFCVAQDNILDNSQTIEDAVNSLKNFLNLLKKNLINDELISNDGVDEVSGKNYNAEIKKLDSLLTYISDELMIKKDTSVIYDDLTQAFFKLSNIAENINSLEMPDKKIKFKDLRKILKSTDNISQIIDKENRMLSMGDSLINNIKEFNESFRNFLINNLANNKFKLDNSFYTKLADIVWYRPVEFIKDHQDGTILTLSGVGTVLVSCVGGWYFFKFLSSKKEKKDNEPNPNPEKNKDDIKPDSGTEKKDDEAKIKKFPGIEILDDDNDDEEKEYHEKVGYNLRPKKHRNLTEYKKELGKKNNKNKKK
ncbi:hypothetical protein K9L05_02065 [Candidatus Babeliales bacterium]|nr:hypothetical protein [Candidatus Babeliales bacterium]MCF7899414.1 hypothetical protein [Candidatus Babeliales bacterium]